MWIHLYNNFFQNKIENHECFKINQNNITNPKGMTMIDSSNNRFLSKIKINNLINNKVKLEDTVVEKDKIKSKIKIINKFSFPKYIYEIIKGGIVKHTWKLLLKFRMKLLSEEHLFQNHLNVFSIGKRLNFNGKVIKCDLKEVFKEL